MQLKAVIKNIAKDKHISAQLVMQNFMLERLLERISVSKYQQSFILKGGFLIAAMVETTYKGEDCYMLTVSGVEAKNLASMFTFKVTTGEGEKSKAATLSYGAFSYASTVFESTHDDKVGIDKLRDVMNSMYLYYDRAVAYDTK